MKKKIIKRFCLNRASVCFFLIAILLSSIPITAFSNQNVVANTEDTNTFELIMQRVQERHKAVNVSTTDNTYTKYYMSILNADGSFSDINYADKSQTNWGPLAHLNRMKYMVLSYTIPTSNYYEDATLYNQIVSMLNYWYDKHPISTNWFNQQIACPQRMGIMLILMRSGSEQLPAALEKKLIERMRTEGGRPDQSGSQGTGANKLDIATHWIYRGCLTKDESALSFGAEQVYYPLFLTTGEGLQHDYSYQQHGNQLHVGGYGFAFVEGISSVATYMTGTEYAMSKEKLNYLSRFVRDAYIPMIRGQYFMYNVTGRALSRPGGLSQSGFHSILSRMKDMDPDHSTEYDQASLRLKATQPASYALQPFNRNFWRSDYMLHQRSGYTFDVRGASTYSCKNENGNQESLKGYFLSEGATELVLDGTEYVNIFCVWDWTRIPGTTTPVLASIPLPAQWGNLGTSKFSGSASDETYGVTTFVYNDPKYSINTQAKKSWFMFDDQIVCLGADITSTATQEINTTINQTLLKGDVYMKDNGGVSQKKGTGASNYTNLSWILHNNIGYFFPEKSNINISNASQSGSWNSINSGQSTDIESKDVFKVWFNHGVKPTKDTYEYILLPNVDLTKMEAYKSDNIEILYNNADIQAVKHKALDILSIVFYKATTFKNGDIEVTVNKPCVVMFRNVSTAKVSTYISDPSRSNSNIRVTTSFPSFKDVKQLDCVLPTLKDAYAGSTVSYVIDENTPTAKGDPKYDVLVVSEDAWVRDGSSSNQNVGGKTNALTIKKDGSGYNREVYLKYDLSGINTKAYQKYLLKLSVSNSNTSISETKWNINYVSNNNWSENTITWDNSPSKGYVIKTVSTVAAPSDLIVDITDFVIREISKGNKILSLNIAATDRGSDGKTDAQFYSKESSNSDNFPQLLLQLSENIEPADILELPVIADSWVRDGADFEKVNYGKTNSLTVKKDNEGYNREAYLKFDINAIKQRKIRKVSLVLNVSNANTSISQINWGIKGTDSNWDEYTITNVNKPATITDIITTEAGVAAGNEVSFDITNFVNAQNSSSSKLISLLLYGINKASDGKSDAQFFSKESSNSDNHPRLVFELEPDISTGIVGNRSSISNSISTESALIIYTTRGIVNITSTGSQIKNVAIYNLNGILVYQDAASSESYSTTQAFGPGVYIVKVKTNTGVESKKIIVQ